MIKNKLFIAAFMLLAFSTTQAQFTLRIAGGYAGPGLQNSEPVLGPKVDPATAGVDALVPMANQNDSAHTYKPVHGSYGTGGNVTVAVGYMFNDYIGIDVGVGYAHSNDISSYQVRSLLGSGGPYIYAQTHSFSYALALTPALVISAKKTNWKVYPYGRFGIVLPVAGKLTDNLTIDGPTGFSLNTAPTWLGGHTDVQLVTQGTISLGFSGAIGVAYRPLPFLSIFAEINGQYLNVRGKSSTVTKWDATSVSSNGTKTTVSDLGTTAQGKRGAYRDQFNYVSQLGPTSNNAAYNPNYNPDAPKEDVIPNSPGSNLGFNIGVTFYLSKKTLKKQDKTTNKK